MFKLILALFTAVVFSQGCYMSITGRVIDAETKQPIEGAIVLVEWTKTHGIGDHSTESYKVTETLSDRDGQVTLEGCRNPFVNFPHIAVYKKGYVVWNDEYIFPNSVRRTDFVWGSGYTFSLRLFPENQSHKKHVSFIRQSIRFSQNSDRKQGISRAIEWEIDKSLNED